MGNAKLLGTKDIESAFVAADILDAAYNGKAQFANAPLKTCVHSVRCIPKLCN